MKDNDSTLRDTLLIAMPAMQDPSFDRTVVYICAHNDAGAMGIVINRPMPDVHFDALLDQLDIPAPTIDASAALSPVVHFGGPVETGRGFVLHSRDFVENDTVHVAEDICMTGTVDILAAIAAGKGPGQSLFALGYAGWGAGQLEAEIESHAWLTVPASRDIIFARDTGRKWTMALNRLGIDPAFLSVEAGHA